MPFPGSHRPRFRTQRLQTILCAEVSSLALSRCHLRGVPPGGSGRGLPMQQQLACTTHTSLCKKDFKARCALVLPTPATAWTLPFVSWHSTQEAISTPKDFQTRSSEPTGYPLIFVPPLLPPWISGSTTSQGQDYTSQPLTTTRGHTTSC